MIRFNIILTFHSRSSKKTNAFLSHRSYMSSPT